MSDAEKSTPPRIEESFLPLHPKRSVVCYGELTGMVLCDRLISYREPGRRGRFGRSSPMRYNKPCPRRAGVQILFDDGSIAVRCKEHTPIA